MTLAYLLACGGGFFTAAASGIALPFLPRGEIAPVAAVFGLGVAVAYASGAAL